MADKEIVIPYTNEGYKQLQKLHQDLIAQYQKEIKLQKTQLEKSKATWYKQADVELRKQVDKMFKPTRFLNAKGERAYNELKAKADRGEKSPLTGKPYASLLKKYHLLPEGMIFIYTGPTINLEKGHIKTGQYIGAKRKNELYSAYYGQGKKQLDTKLANAYTIAVKQLEAAQKKDWNLLNIRISKELTDFEKQMKLIALTSEQQKSELAQKLELTQKAEGSVISTASESNKNNVFEQLMSQVQPQSEAIGQRPLSSLADLVAEKQLRLMGKTEEKGLGFGDIHKNIMKHLEKYRQYDI